VILRDLHRTFPAHDYFKENGGHGQDALAKIVKAYSIYDEEIGYCQGITFIAAALLLHVSFIFNDFMHLRCIVIVIDIVNWVLSRYNLRLYRRLNVLYVFIRLKSYLTTSCM